MKKFTKRARARVIWLQYFMATFLKIALPNIVNPAIIEAIREEIRIILKSPAESIIIFATMLAPAAPDKIPHTSPITSLQTELTLSALLIKLNAWRLPFTFLADIAVNGSIEQDATAKPTMSNKMLRAMKTKMTTIAIMMFALLKTSSLSMLKDKERTMAIIRIKKGHSQSFLDLFLFSFFIYKMLNA